MAQSDIPEIDLAYAFTIRLDSGGRIEFEGPMRSRVFEPATGGEVWGPRLQGRVVPQSGADYATNDMMDAHVMLQASDGTWLYMNLVGYEHESSAEGSSYFRVSPSFDTPSGPHEWLSRTVFIATAERHQNPAHIIVHCYELL